MYKSPYLVYSNQTKGILVPSESIEIILSAIREYWDHSWCHQRVLRSFLVLSGSIEIILSAIREYWDHY